MSNIKPGQKLTCIDDSNQYGPFLKKGEVYTVDYINNKNGGIVVKEVQSKGPITETKNWHGYRPERFRPLDYTFVENVIESLKQH